MNSCGTIVIFIRRLLLLLDFIIERHLALAVLHLELNALLGRLTREVLLLIALKGLCMPDYAPDIRGRVGVLLAETLRWGACDRVRLQILSTGRVLHWLDRLGADLSFSISL